MKAYDLGGRLASTTAVGVNLGDNNPKNVVLEDYSYNAAGKKATSRSPHLETNPYPWEGTLTTYLYDGLGRGLLQVQDPGGTVNARTSHAWSYADMLNGHAMTIHEVTSPEGLKIVIFVDERGREIAKTQVSGSAERRTWTEIAEPTGGAPAKTETTYGPAPDNRTITSYNGAGKVIRTQDQAGGDSIKALNERGLPVCQRN